MTRCNASRRNPPSKLKPRTRKLPKEKLEHLLITYRWKSRQKKAVNLKNLKRKLARFVRRQTATYKKARTIWLEALCFQVRLWETKMASILTKSCSKKKWTSQWWIKWTRPAGSKTSAQRSKRRIRMTSTTINRSRRNSKKVISWTIRSSLAQMQALASATQEGHLLNTNLAPSNSNASRVEECQAHI